MPSTLSSLKYLTIGFPKKGHRLSRKFTGSPTTTASTQSNHVLIMMDESLALTIATMIGGFLSLIACYVTIRECISDILSEQNRMKTAIPKMTLAMISAYFVHALTCVLGPVPAPRDGSWGSFGTTQTCTVQGFLHQYSVSVAAVLLTALIGFYMLVVCYNPAEDRLIKCLRCIQISTVILFFFIAAVGLPFNFYNPIGIYCWVGPYPMGCKETATCTRGTSAGLYAAILCIFPYVPCIISGFYFHIKIYRRVRETEDRISRYGERSTDIASSSSLRVTAIDRTKSKSVATQAALFLSIFTSLVILNTAYVFSDNFILRLATDFLDAFQGFLYFIVFSRPRGNNNMATPEGRVLRTVVFGLCCCCPQNVVYNIVSRFSFDRLSKISQLPFHSADQSLDSMVETRNRRKSRRPVANPEAVANHESTDLADDKESKPEPSAEIFDENAKLESGQSTDSADMVDEESAKQSLAVYPEEEMDIDSFSSGKEMEIVFTLEKNDANIPEI